MLITSKILDCMGSKVDLFELFCDHYVENQAGYHYIMLSFIPEAAYVAMSKKREYVEYDFGPNEFRSIARMYERKAIREIFESQLMSDLIEKIVYRDEDPNKLDLPSAAMICEIFFNNCPSCIQIAADGLVREYEKENNIVLLRTTKLPVNCSNTSPIQDKEDASKLKKLASTFSKAAKLSNDKKMIQLASMYMATDMACRISPKRINPDLVAAMGYRELINNDKISLMVCKTLYGYIDPEELSKDIINEIFNIYYLKNCKYNFGITTAASYADPEEFKSLCGRK